MKKSLIIVSSFFFVSSAGAQYNPVTSMQSDFKDIATFSKNKRQSGFEGLQSYSSGEIKGSQFFYPSFAKGSVTTTNYEVISNLYLFLFDKVRQLLFIMSKDDQKQPPEILLAEKEQIRSFTISTDRDHVFMPAHNYIPENNTDFYEVLKRNDSAYTVLKFVKTTFEKMDTRDIEKVRRGDMYDEFVDKTNYYISYKMGRPQPVKLKRNDIISVFPASRKEFVQGYFKDHDRETVNESFLISLVDELNK